MKNLLIFSITSSILLFLGIIILEIIFGNLVFKKDWKDANNLNIIRDYESKTTINNLISEGSDYQITYTRDIYGLRGSCKYDDLIDILTIGGSTTDQRYISDEKTFQELLQKSISNHIGRDICIFNAGVDGHSTFGHIKSFDHWFSLIPNFNPKIILLYVGINDAGFRNYPSLDSDDSTLKNTIFKNSVIIKSIKRLKYIINSLFSKNIYGDHLILHPKSSYNFTETQNNENLNDYIDSNTENFKNRLKILLKKISKYDSTVVCISQPHFLIQKFGDELKGIDIAFEYQNIKFNGLDFEKSLTELNKVMQNVCENNNHLFIEIQQEKFSFEEDFYDPVHMLPSGNQKLASIIFKEMKNSKILSYLEY